MLTVHCRSRQLHTVGSRCDQHVRIAAASPFSRPGTQAPAGARACRQLLCNAINSSRKDTGANGSSSNSSRRRSRRGSTAASAAATATGQQQEQQAPVVTHLEELSLSGYALVPSAVVALRPGLNVLSGQSGAGKSVLLGALDLLAGGAAPPDCVRPPADMALLQATWRLAPAEAEAAGQLLAEMGLPAKAAPQPADAAGAAVAAAGSVLHVRREISTAGAAAGGGTRSRVLINSVPSSLRVLRALAGLLLDLNGQGASAALRDGQQQLQLLDKIAGTTAAAARLSELVSRLAWLEGRLAQLDGLADEGQRTALQRRVSLIRRAGLRPGEEEGLQQRLAALESRRSCLEAAAAVAAGIRGDSGGAAGSGGGLTEGLRLVMSQLRGVLAAEETQQRLAAAAAAAARQGSREGSGTAADEGNEGVGDNGDEEDEEAEDDDVSAGSSSAGVSALRAALEELELVEDGLAEAAGQLSLYADAARYSAAEAAEAAARLDLIETLSRRFRVRGAGACQQLLGLAESWSDQLEAYHEAAGQAEGWAAEAAQLQQQVTQLAVALSQQRRAAAAGLAAAVQGQLVQLAMADTRFAVDLTWQPVRDTAQLQAGPGSRAVLAPTAADPRCNSDVSPAAAGDAAAAAAAASGSDGAGALALYRLTPAGSLDSVQFLMSPGPSEPLRPLAATASGGEAARILLALKAAPSAAAAAAAAAAVGAQSEAVAAAAAAAAVVGAPVLVLDEPDAGVGSRLGEPLARLLRRLVAASSSSSSSSGAAVRPVASQVLVVTHTPQIAAAAGHHIQVVKAAGPDGRVITSFRHLSSQQERVAELADMLGLGEDEGANLAAELLAAAAAADEQEQEWQGSSDGYTANSSSSSQVEAAAAEDLTGRREEPPWAEAAAAESAPTASSSDGSSPAAAGRLLLGLSVAAATAGAVSFSAAAAADVGDAPSPSGQQQLQPAQHWHI